MSNSIHGSPKFLNKYRVRFYGKHVAEDHLRRITEQNNEENLSIDDQTRF